MNDDTPAVEVRAIRFESGEVSLQFQQRQDLRSVEGDPVLLVRQLTLPVDHVGYAEQIQELAEDAQRLVLDILPQYQVAETWAPPALEEDDDDDL